VPRSFTTEERDLIKAAAVTHVLTCDVLSVDDTWDDLADIVPGASPLVGATVTNTVDARAYSATVRVIRGLGTTSLSPLIQGSDYNRDAGDSYAPRINGGTGIRLYSHTIAATDDPSEDTVKLVFDGRVDDPDFSGDVMTLTCRDLGGKLLDTIITDDRTYGDEDTPVAADAVAQQLLTDNADILGESITLSVPDAPTYLVTKYEQVLVSVMDALNNLAMLFGWVIRYEFDETTDAFALTLFDPQRDKVTPDYTLEATEYLEVEEAKLNTTNVRNHIRVYYVDGVTGESLYQEAIDSGSVAVFGRRFMQLGGDATAAITNGNDALALAEFALSDLSTPLFDHTVKSTYTWFARIGDLVGWTANDVHYDADQALAIVGFTHEFPDGGQGAATTSFQCRGKPAGAYERWLRLQGGPVLPTLPPAPSFSDPLGEGVMFGNSGNDGDVIVSYGFNAGVDEIRLFAEIGDGTAIPVPDKTSTTLAQTIRRPEGDIGDNPDYSSIAVLSTRQGFYKKLRGDGTRNGLSSPDWISNAVQAVDPVPAITRGTLAPGGLEIARTGDTTNTVTVTPGTLDTSVSNFVVIMRNEQELPPIYIGTSTAAVVFVDSGLDLSNPQKSFTYDAFILSARTDANGKWVAAVTGQRFRTVTNNPAAADAPQWALGTPAPVVVVAVPKVQLSWTATTPGAGAVRVEASLDRIAKRVVGQDALASGTVYDNDTSPKLYRLVAINILTNAEIAASEWVWYTGGVPPLSNPGTLPQFVNGTPKVAMVAGAPTPKLALVVQWTCATPLAWTIVVQRSTAGSGGPWVDLSTPSPNVASGTWIDPDPTDVTTDAWYRLQAHALLGPVLATSAAVHFIP